MIPAQTQRSVETSPVAASASFGISQNDVAHILTMLRDTLYSDRVLAVLSTTMPEESAEQEATDAAVKQLSAMTKDELAKYLRRKLHVVGPLPETRMELLSLATDVAR